MKKLILLNIFLLVFSVACFNSKQNTLLLISTLQDDKYSQMIERGAMKAAEDYNVLLQFNRLGTNSSLQEQKEVLLLELEKKKPYDAIAMSYSYFDSGYLEEVFFMNTNRNIPLFVFGEKPTGDKSVIDKNIKKSFYTDNLNIISLAVNEIFEALEERVRNYSRYNKAKITVFEYASKTNDTFIGEYFEKQFESKITNEQITTTSDDYEIEKIVLGDDFDLEEIFSSLVKDKVFAIFFTETKILESFLASYRDLEIESAAKDGESMIIVGVDAGQLLVDAIREGFVYGSILKNPYLVGYFTVESMVTTLKNLPTPPQRIVSKWYDRENIDSREITAILY